MPTSAPAVPESRIENMTFGSELPAAYAHRIIEDVCLMLGISDVPADRLKIYQPDDDHFEVAIDVTLEGVGENMIYVKGLEYKFPQDTKNKFTINRVLNTHSVTAAIFNTDGCTRPLDSAEKENIARVYNLQITADGSIHNLASVTDATRKSVSELVTVPPSFPAKS